MVKSLCVGVRYWCEVVMVAVVMVAVVVVQGTFRIVEWRRFRRCAAAACSVIFLSVGSCVGGARCILASRNANISSFVLKRG